MTRAEKIAAIDEMRVGLSVCINALRSNDVFDSLANNSARFNR